jgi:hypothetical protein
MGVVNMPSGRPTMALTGGARKRLDTLTPKGYAAQIDLSITDEGPMSMAFVVISAVPTAKTPRKRAAANPRRNAARPWRAAAEQVRISPSRILPIWRTSKTALDIAFHACAPRRVWRVKARPHLGTTP